MPSSLAAASRYTAVQQMVHWQGQPGKVWEREILNRDRQWRELAWLIGGLVSAMVIAATKSRLSPLLPKVHVKTLSCEPEDI